MTTRIRVLVVDDDESLRRLLQVVLSLEDDIDVVGMAENAADAVQQAAETVPDVIVLDNHMPGRTGIDVLPDLLGAGAGAIVMYSAHVSPAERQTAARLGVELCPKEGETKDLIEAIRRVRP